MGHRYAQPGCSRALRLGQRNVVARPHALLAPIMVAMLLALPAASAAAPAHAPAGWWRGGVFYQVFVRSFADSNGDGIGDLRGLIERLDLLNDGDAATTSDLGVDALWLMPIHPSPSYHGYDVVDYQGVHPDYGTLADLDALIEAAHARNVRVIIDLVLNHSSTAHPWFLASSNPAHPEHSRFRDHYHWREVAPDWKRPWDGARVWHQVPDGRFYYGLFWGGMPDLNLESPAVLEELTQAMRFWLARGVDGFRLDAVRHLSETPDGMLSDVPGSHAILRKLRAVLDREFPGALLVGEAWSDTAVIARYTGRNDQLHLAFSFGVAEGLVQAVVDGQRLPLEQALGAAESSFVERGVEAPFLTNHDMVRAMRRFGGDPAKAKLAAALLFALPGTPFVYYGEELGMQGGLTKNDEDKRTPMRFSRARSQHGFTSAARAWHTSPELDGVDIESQRRGGLWRHYQQLIALRHAERALSLGSATRPALIGKARGTFALLREADGERVLFVANLHSEEAPPFAVEVARAGAKAPTLLHSSGPVRLNATAGALKVTGLGGRGYAFVKLTP